jgi:hypothetical protein
MVPSSGFNHEGTYEDNWGCILPLARARDQIPRDYKQKRGECDVDIKTFKYELCRKLGIYAIYIKNAEYIFRHVYWIRQEAQWMAQYNCYVCRYPFPTQRP